MWHVLVLFFIVSSPPPPSPPPPIQVSWYCLKNIAEDRFTEKECTTFCAGNEAICCDASAASCVPDIIGIENVNPDTNVPYWHDDFLCGERPSKCGANKPSLVPGSNCFSQLGAFEPVGLADAGSGKTIETCNEECTINGYRYSGLSDPVVGQDGLTARCFCQGRSNDAWDTTSLIPSGNYLSWAWGAASDASVKSVSMWKMKAWKESCSARRITPFFIPASLGCEEQTSNQDMFLKGIPSAGCPQNQKPLETNARCQLDLSYNFDCTMWEYGLPDTDIVALLVTWTGVSDSSASTPAKIIVEVGTQDSSYSFDTILEIQNKVPNAGSSLHQTERIFYSATAETGAIGWKKPIFRIKSVREKAMLSIIVEDVTVVKKQAL